MTYAVYELLSGKRVRYECREIKKGSFTRFGIFDGNKEIQPEDRNERFIKYEMER